MYFYFIAFYLLIICISANDIGETQVGKKIKIHLAPKISSFFKYFDTHAHAASMLTDDEAEYHLPHTKQYKKNAIPIELQKALYAHGIVGRRR